MKAVDRANAALAAAVPRVDGRYKGGFHLSPPAGWMNDPNGLAFHGGLYHVFYQHNPFAPRWGRMHWGHAVTRDFVSWEHRRVALAPDRPYESLLGCFSGSAIVKGGALNLMYTGVSPFGQTQCLASSTDGEAFAKDGNNPVIPRSKLPPRANTFHFRDPKVFALDGSYGCLAGARDKRDGTGLILLFRSDDLSEWRYSGVFLPCPEAAMVECPDILRMDDGRDLVICSLANRPRDGDRFRNLHSVAWSSGRLDARSGEFSGTPFAEIDSGFDFYAAQVLKTEDGRAVMIAWMQMWKRSMPTSELGHRWAGSMILPRELTLSGSSLIQAPVREIESYRAGGVRYANRRFSGELTLEDVEGDRIELLVRADVSRAKRFGLRLFSGTTHRTAITWDSRDGRVVLDRGSSGILIRDFARSEPRAADDDTRSAKIDLVDGTLSMRIFLDRSSVEAFLQRGEAVLTATVYPDTADTGVVFFCEGEATLVSVEKYDIRV